MKGLSEETATKRRPLAAALAFAVFCCVLVTVVRPAFAADGYQQTNLVSNLSGGAKVTDSNLVNSWGITHPPTGPWWVNDNGTGLSTVYNGSGERFPINSPLVVTIPTPGGSGIATPTGIIFNGTKDFELQSGFPARFLFVTEDGTISGWNPDVPSPNSVTATLKVNNSSSAVYKGGAMALNGGTLYLYVANFRGGTVDVFDTDFNKVTMPQGSFTDPNVPAGFAPFNVMNISGRVVVTYAKQDSTKKDDVAGRGNGYVDVYDPNGTLLMRLQHGPWLNSPWGVALAPANFGRFSNRLLVGNFGSGEIAAYNAVTGTFLGRLTTADNKTIVIDGLWGIGFGNGATAGPSNTLFFAAGPNDEKNGLFGTLTAVSK